MGGFKDSRDVPKMLAGSKTFEQNINIIKCDLNLQGYDVGILWKLSFWIAWLTGKRMKEPKWIMFGEIHTCLSWRFIMFEFFSLSLFLIIKSYSILNKIIPPSNWNLWIFHWQLNIKVDSNKINLSLFTNLIWFNSKQVRKN